MVEQGDSDIQAGRRIRMGLMYAVAKEDHMAYPGPRRVFRFRGYVDAGATEANIPENKITAVHIITDTNYDKY